MGPGLEEGEWHSAADLGEQALACTCHDRMHEEDFNLSHEFLAVMLGVQRPTVSVVAATLQEAGLIRYARGRVTVRNRKGLEKASCECYALIRGHFDGLRL